jgi:uncharacterized protein
MKFNPISWFEIPVVDMARAKAFYTAVFQTTFTDITMPGTEMAMFAYEMEKPGAGGALVKDAFTNPSAQPGLMIYFSCEDVAVELGRAEAAGGQVVTPKTSLGEFGFMGSFLDSEGNLISVHSNA